MLFLIDAQDNRRYYSYLPQVPVRSTPTGILQENPVTWIIPGTGVSHVTSFQKVISDGGAEGSVGSRYSSSEYFIRFGIFCPKRCPRQKLDPYVTSTLAY